MNKRFLKCLEYYRPYIALLLLDLLCAVVISAIALAFPLVARQTIINLSIAAAWQVMAGSCLFMLALIILYTICKLFVGYYGHVMGARMERDMRKEVFSHMGQLSHSFYDTHSVGQLMTVLTNDTLQMTELFHHGPEDILIAGIQFFGTFAILAALNIKLALTVFCLLPLMALYAVYFFKKMRYMQRVNKEHIGNINARAEDCLSGIKTVKGYTNEAWEEEKFQIENDRFLKSRSKTYKMEAVYSDVVDSFALVITMLIVLFGGMSAADGTMELVDVITFLLYSANLFIPIRTLVNFSRLYQEGMASFDRFMGILETEQTITCQAVLGGCDTLHGDITFSHVYFQYPNAGQMIVEDVNLHINAGESIALIGRSGVGKTTLCALLPRFYDISNGQILLDGIDCKEIPLAKLRQSIGIVAQETYLFSGTICDNIRYGNRNATIEEIITAAKKANAHDFISVLPNGYDSDVGTHGATLSGGQRQRISIARMFLKNPAILIFDEATSALDSTSERQVVEAMHLLMQSRTTIIIAHRLSTIKHAKRILVLDDKHIAEDGNHASLLEEGGLYTQLMQEVSLK